MGSTGKAGITRRVWATPRARKFDERFAIIPLAKSSARPRAVQGHFECEVQHLHGFVTSLDDKPKPYNVRLGSLRLEIGE